MLFTIPAVNVLHAYGSFIRVQYCTPTLHMVAHFSVRISTSIYSGTSLIRTPLGAEGDVLICEVS